ncbi:acyltransferase [Novosphingobium sp. P6W]|uniref:acyltransferase family protein n=1 Tax=Novosphingobium sp. P6W TaxID=1609758 RepID=UPI000698894A|nr:acyltransferase [Novosphingobium sp. P6W]AXB76373.1 acyltransferase [Novosphingobium sp. P6W]
MNPATTDRPKGPGRLVLLDGLRGVAAIGVVLFHAQLSGAGHAFSRGYLFVDLFFLLSGFVLTLAFETRFAGGLAATPFLRQRLRRFLPMIAAGAAMGFLALLGRDYPLVACVLALVVSAAMIPLPMATIFPLNPPQWSLMVELIANAVHARWLHRMTSAQLLALACACALGMAAMMARAGDGNLGAGIAQLPAGLLRAGWSYTLGIVLARIWRERRPAPLLDWRIALLLPVPVVMALPFLPLVAWGGDVIVITVVFPALFWIAASAVPTQSGERILETLGAISFPLYAVHFPILLAADRFGGGEPGRVVGIFAAIAVAAILARAISQRASARRPLPVPLADA